MRVFLAADVLFSASEPGSASGRLIAATLEQSHVMTSDVTVEEARRNLGIKRPVWLESFEALLAELEIVASSVFSLPVTLVANHVPTLCAAVRAKSQCFVTGDRRDFGHLLEQTVLGVTVITPLRLAHLQSAQNGPK